MDQVFRWVFAVVILFLSVQWVDIDLRNMTDVTYGAVIANAAEVNEVPVHIRPHARWVPPILTDEVKKEVACLADNIYYEAGIEDATGKIAVAAVVLNRMNDPRFPGSTPCAVVYEGAKYPKEKAHKQKGGCQFSWLCQGKKPENPNPSVWEEGWRIAVDVYVNGFYDDFLPPNVVFYHAEYVSPRRWPYRFHVRIGRHLFYIG